VRIKNDHILGHEQGHFDITELHARKLYKDLKEYKFRKGSVSNDINQIYNQVVNELQQMQNDYDKESDHSRNFRLQKEWESRIAEDLGLYKSFSGYNKKPSVQ
jgi:predicted secreted Zn-dependent protease